MEGMIVFEMSWNPIEDNTDIILMQMINQIFQIIAGAIETRGGKKVRYLITIFPSIGVIQDALQFDMGKSHLTTVSG